MYWSCHSTLPRCSSPICSQWCAESFVTTYLSTQTKPCCYSNKSSSAGKSLVAYEPRKQPHHNSRFCPQKVRQARHRPTGTGRHISLTKWSGGERTAWGDRSSTWEGLVQHLGGLWVMPPSWFVHLLSPSLGCIGQKKSRHLFTRMPLSCPLGSSFPPPLSRKKESDHHPMHHPIFQDGQEPRLPALPFSGSSPEPSSAFLPLPPPIHHLLEPTYPPPRLLLTPIQNASFQTGHEAFLGSAETGGGKKHTHKHKSQAHHESLKLVNMSQLFWVTATSHESCPSHWGV